MYRIANVGHRSINYENNCSDKQLFYWKTYFKKKKCNDEQC